MTWRLAIPLAVWFCLSSGLRADAPLTLLFDALKIPEVTRIMRDEGLGYAGELDSDMLNGQGGPFWTGLIDDIYAANRMNETVRRALEAGLSDRDTEIALAFFASELGTEIVGLENASRMAMQDDLLEESAREACGAPAVSDTDHLALIERFIRSNDLIERNVAGALSSNFQFYSGLVEGGYLAMSEPEVIEDVYGQEPEIRADTEQWLCGYLLLAYRSLPLEGLEAYVAFYETDAGRALNAALFEGYEEMYRDISYALGRAVALSAAGDDI